MFNSSLVIETPLLKVNCSSGLLPWLMGNYLSLAFTTYQTNRLFFIGSSDEGALKLHERLWDKPMGLYGNIQKLYLSTRYQIWEFHNVLLSGESYEKADALYVPRASYITGNLNVHDIALNNSGNLIFVNRDFSCLAKINENYSFIPLWKPPFISKLVAEDRCHLNGLAMVRGEPFYVTACSATDVTAGWRNYRVDGGVVIDVSNNEILVEGLSLPHSPRWYHDKLWLLNSGTGEFGYISANQFFPLTFCPGFLRGLAFWDNVALVGLSKLRHTFSGLVLEERLTKQGVTPQCGLMMIDITSGEVLHWLYLEGVIEELFDVLFLPGVRQPQSIGLQNDDIQRLVTFPNSGGPVFTKPTVKRPSLGKTAPVAGLPFAQSSQTIKYQRVYNLTPSNLLAYEQLTFPPLSERWSTHPLAGELIGVSASLNGTIIGFAIAELGPDLTAELLSLLVLPAYQSQGIGTHLVQSLETELIKNNYQQIWVSYEVTESTSFALEPLLKKLNWQPPQADPKDFKRWRWTSKIFVSDFTPSSTPEAELKRGKQLRQQGDFARAIVYFNKTIRIKPDYWAAYNQLGKAFLASGKIEEASTVYQHLLQLNPALAVAHSNLGAILQLQGKNLEAIAAYEEAIQLQPDLALAHLNLAKLLAYLGQINLAETHFQEAIKLSPESAGSYYAYGLFLKEQHSLEKAIKCFEATLKRKSNFWEAYHSLGQTLMSLAQFEAAKFYYERGIELKPDAIPLLLDLGELYAHLNQLIEAQVCYEKALNQDSIFRSLIFYELSYIRQNLCDWKDYEQRMEKLEEAIHFHLKHFKDICLKPLNLNVFPVPQSLHRRVAEHFVEAIKQKVAPLKARCHFSYPSLSVERWRIGYVSGDFCYHAVGLLIQDLFQYHDREKFTVYAYSLRKTSDEIQSRIQANCDQFVDLSVLSTEAAAQRIHEDGIHILVDLSGYTAYCRPEILALRPAPIQCSYLGYPDTMGGDFIDYLITDRWVVPPESASHYSEEIIYLPHQFVSSPLLPSKTKQTRSQWGLPEDGFVFCCFNNHRKIDPTVFTVWMNILNQVPGSVLWLSDGTDVVKDNLRAAALSQGIHSNRLVFAPYLPLADYLTRCTLADLFLDTFSYSAGSTAICALSAGLPVLTLPGSKNASRLGASICAAAGLQSFICNNIAAYEQKAVFLATDSTALTVIRQQLANPKTLPLFQIPQWIQSLEAAMIEVIKGRDKN